MAASTPTKLLFINCDHLVDLQHLRQKLLEFDTISAIESRIDYFNLHRMDQKTDEILKTKDDNKPDVAIFVVHAGESRLSINEPNAGIGYARIYNALKEVTGDKVIVVIAHDSSYCAKDQLLSPWSRSKVASQFNEGHIDGPEGFLFSWKDCPQPCHSRMILQYLQCNFRENTKLKHLQVPEKSTGTEPVHQLSVQEADGSDKKTAFEERSAGTESRQQMSVHKVDDIGKKTHLRESIPMQTGNQAENTTFCQVHTSGLINSAIERYRNRGLDVVQAQAFDDQGRRCILLENKFQLPRGELPNLWNGDRGYIKMTRENNLKIIFFVNKNDEWKLEKEKIHPCPTCCAAESGDERGRVVRGKNCQDPQPAETEEIIHLPRDYHFDKSTTQALEKYEQAEKRNGECTAFSLYAIAPETEINTDTLCKFLTEFAIKNPTEQNARPYSDDKLNQELKFIICIRKKDGYEVLLKNIHGIQARTKKLRGWTGMFS